jgi:hypothetical protein
MARTFIESGTDVLCRCHADTAEIEVVGMGTFSGNFEGFMEVRTGKETRENGLATMLLEIRGHETKGHAPQVGAIKVSHDSDRPSKPSRIQELVAGTRFPASQEMYVNINVTFDALPNVVLRNVETGLLKCDSQDSFPPENSEYVLQEPMDLEDAANPGVVIARMVAYTALINPD